MAEKMFNNSQDPLTNSKITFYIQPLQSMFDEDITVRIDGLIAHKKYTIMATCQPSTKAVLFYSLAHYISDGNGLIDVSHMPSYGGTYVGIEPMGLIWSMEPCPEGDRGCNRYQMRTPQPKFNINFAIYESHLDKTDIDIPNKYSITQLCIERFSVSPNTERMDVNEGRLRGTLFIPRGQGTFPGVLELYGISYGIHCDLRASVLAAHGFVTFALAYANYKDLPDEFHLELEYFLEAVEYLHSLPSVAKEGVIVLGHCNGGTVGYHLAAVNKKIIAVLSTASCSYILDGKMTYQNQELKTFKDGSRISVSDGVEFHFHAFPLIDKYTVPLERSRTDALFLILHGADDTVIHTGHAYSLARRLQKAGRKQSYRLVTLPGTGHSCYLPNAQIITQSGRTPGTNEIMFLGGTKYSQERGQCTAWEEILTFLECIKLSLAAKATTAQQIIMSSL